MVSENEKKHLQSVFKYWGLVGLAVYFSYKWRWQILLLLQTWLAYYLYMNSPSYLEFSVMVLGDVFQYYVDLTSKIILSGHAHEMFLLVSLFSAFLVYLWWPQDSWKSNLSVNTIYIIAASIVVGLLSWVFTESPSAVLAFSAITDLGTNIVKTVWVASGMFLFLVYSRVAAQFSLKILFEQFILVHFVILIGCWLISVTDLLTLFLLIVGLNVSLYSLIAQPKTQSSTEAAMKYLSLGVPAMGFLLLGILCLYVEYGTLSLELLRSLLVSVGESVRPLTTLEQTAIIFISLGFLFKLSAFPGYTWAADTYAGASIFVCAILILTKLPVFISFKIIVGLFQASPADSLVQALLIICGIGSIFVGTFGPIMQQTIKRFLAFSSINHVGLMLIGLSCEGQLNVASMLYVYGYMFSIVTFISVLLLAREQNGAPVVFIADIRRLFKQSFFFSVIGCLALFSLAGIPIFIGFFAKFGVLLTIYASLSSASVLPAAALSTALGLLVYSTYNYLRIIKVSMFSMIETPTPPLFILDEKVRFINFILCCLSFVLTFGFGLFWWTLAPVVV